MLNAKQLQAHYSGIGGSMAASILGVDQYQSNVDAYLLLTDEEYRRQNQLEMFDNIHVQIGNALENIVADQIQREQGWELLTVDEPKIDPEFPFLIGNVDRLINNKREIVEIKVRGQYAVKSYGEEGTDAVLDSDFIQVQHYLKLYDYDRAHLCCFDLGTKVTRYYTVERDESFIQVVRPILVDFWENNVKKLIPPAPLKYEDAARVWSKAIPVPVVGTPEIIKLAYRAKKTGQVKRRLEEKEKSLKLEIASFMQEHDTLLDEDKTPILTYKTQDANRIDVTLLRSQQPLIAQQYTKNSPSRVMRFKK